MTPAALYTRVSTQKQADEGYSLDAQERRCREHIEREGWETRARRGSDNRSVRCQHSGATV